MKPTEERRVLTDLRSAVRVLSTLEPELLDALARDDQRIEDRPFAGLPPADFVHRQVRSVCRLVTETADRVHHARNVLRQLDADEPTEGRTVSVPDCLACGNLALPRPKAGFCGACYMAYYRRDEAKLPDRAAFIRWRSQESVTTVTTPKTPGQSPGDGISGGVEV